VGWILVVTWLTRIILICLVVMSVYALSIIIERRKFFRLNSLDLGELSSLKNISGVANLTNGSGVFGEQIKLLTLSDNIEKTLDSNTLKYKSIEEGKLSTLGTFGSTAPFIGLLGTVFGIIVAFGELSTGKIDTNGIMFSLAEALILTAVGLVVAIPSVMFFNFYGRELKNQKQQVLLVTRTLK